MSSDRISLLELAKGVRHLSKRAPRAAVAGVKLLLLRPKAPISLGALLQETTGEHGHRPAVKSEEGVLTYAQLNAWANRIAYSLRMHGVRKGDAVSVMLANRPALLASVAGLAKLGAVPAMINIEQRRSVLAHSFSAVGATHHLIGEECMEAFTEVRGEVEGEALFFLPDPAIQTEGAHKIPEGFVDLLADAEGRPILDPPSTSEVKAGDPCFYIFTSGTTGLPKASIMSHDRWAKAAALVGPVVLDIGPEDTVYAPLPLYHNQALTISWAAAVGTGAALAIRRRFSARRFLDDCRRYDATVMVYIGEIIRYLMNLPPDPRDAGSPIRKGIGVGLRPELWSPFKERFGVEEVYEIYAASELNLAFMNVFNLEGTVGISPLPFKLVRWDPVREEPFRDNKGRLVEVKRGEVGLLISKVSERFPFDGYTDKEASEKKLLRSAFEEGDVWINSGDLLRDIGFGHLRFVDRVGDTFRFRGENVSTRQVERAVGQAPGVSDCCVYGVEIPGVGGRAGMAAVVLKEGQELDPEALLRHLKEELPSYAVPVFLRVVDSLEVTGTFKHRKVDLREEAYALARVGEDPVYLLHPKERRYLRLDAELSEALRDRKLGF